MDRFHYPLSIETKNMSSKNNNPEQHNAVENLNSSLVNAGRMVEEKKKVIFWICGGVLVVAAFVLAYLFIYKEPRINKSWEEYARVEIEAQGNDSLATEGYKKVANKYGSTGGGNLAALNAGEALYLQGKYTDAITYLNKFSTSEKVLQCSVTRLIGDCYVNLKKYNDAISYFDKAYSEADDNPQLAPAILMKKANIYEAQKKYSEALDVYEEIKSKYPEFKYGMGMDAYIARAKARLGK